jgi:RNA polymerase sigma-70 factor (ECF subfamily)
VHTASSPARSKASDALEACLDRWLLTGDTAAIERVVSETRPRLLAAARRIGAPQDAEDAVQTAYLSLVRHRGAPLDAPLLPWLLTAVVRNAYRRKAIQRRETTLAERLARPRPPGEVPGAHAVAAEDVARLRATVVRLPARYRDPAVLHLLEGLSIAEVGRLLDLPEGTVRTRLHRARRLLRARLLGVAVDPRVLSAVLALPWFLADVGGDAAPAGGGGNAVLAAGAATKVGVVGVLAALALAVGLGVGALVGAPSEDDERRAAARAARARELEAEVAALRREVARLPARRSEPSLAAATPTAAAKPLSAAPPPSVPVPKPPASAAAAPAVARAAGTPPIAFEGARIETWDVDWADVGRRLHEMVPMVSEFAERWGTSKDPRLADLAGRLSSLNGPLVAYAMKAGAALQVRGRLAPDTGVNGAFVHPWFMANAIAATLEAAGKPLTAEQVAAVRRAAEAGAQARSAASGDPGATFAVERVVAESAERAAFFVAVSGALDPAQRSVLWHEGGAGRLQGDLFSPALLWTSRADIVRFSTRDDLGRQVLDRLGVRRFPESRRPSAERVVDEWIAGWHNVVASAPGDSASLQGFVPAAWVEEAARRQVALGRRLIEAGAVDEAGARELREATQVRVPVRAGAGR